MSNCDRDVAMGGPLPKLDDQVSELLSVLDEEVGHIEAALIRLDTLRTLLIKRDDTALAKLLEDIHRQGETHAATERKRQTLRDDLAKNLGWNRSDLTLSRLQAHLAEPGRTALARRQRRLHALIGQLRREHTLTVLLLSDCAKFNRSLLRAFFGPAAGAGTTYSPTGAAQHAAGTTLLNMQF
jgi:hypothetical protein